VNGVGIELAVMRASILFLPKLNMPSRNQNHVGWIAQGGESSVANVLYTGDTDRDIDSAISI